MSTVYVNGGTNVYIRQNISIQYSFDKNNPDSWSALAFPVIIVNSSTSSGTATVIFTTDISINNINQYFICGSSYIQFGSSTLNSDGSRPTFIISAGVNGYPGLIRNGTIPFFFFPGSGYNDISIYNLIINGSAATLASGGGWIAHRYFANNALRNSIVNCSSIGDIPDTGGGISGWTSARGNSSLTIIGCTTSGNIGTNGGGIVGPQSATNSSNALLTISRCSSSGSIGTDAGGIIGSTSGSPGRVNITNCYSTGIINGGGGILGKGCGAAYGTADVSNCYSTGNIINGGGIFGTQAGLYGTASTTNCFSTGAMTNNSGGIFAQDGMLAGAINCYSSGSVDGTSNGIWAGYSNDNHNGVNNYSEAAHGNGGTWSTTNAAAHLTGVPSNSYYGTTWCSPVVGEPYQLSLSGYTPYSISLTEATSQSIIAGDSTTGGIVPGYTYSLLAINGSFPSNLSEISINSTTGVLRVNPYLKAGVYTINIYSSINPYSITSFTLDVSALVIMPTPCCALPMNLPKNDYVKRNEVIGGNAILGNIPEDINKLSLKNRRQLLPAYGFYYNMKMAQASKNGKN